MDQNTELIRLLTQIRDGQEALVEETRMTREHYDQLREIQERMALRMFLGVIGTIVIILGGFFLLNRNNVPANDNPTFENQDRQYQRQLDRVDESLDRSEKLAKREEELQERWRKQADRVEAVISKWEKAAPGK